MSVETLEEALRCRKCGTLVSLIEEAVSGEDYEVGECLLINCPNAGCCQWCYCKSCKKRFMRTNQHRHSTGNAHLDLHKKAYPHKKAKVAAPPDDPDDMESDGFQGFQVINEFTSASDLETSRAMRAMEHDLETTYKESADNAMNKINGPTPAQVEDPEAQFPRINMKGNEWLVKAMESVHLATFTEMHAAFADENVAGMKSFWMAEAGCGSGRCGGGLSLVTAKAFQQQGDSRLDCTRLPDFDEAYWQFKNLLQYHSMNDKQRRRQADINKTREEYSPGSFFKQTCVPSHRQIGKYYGTSGGVRRYSMLEGMPIPRAVNYEGVALTRPKDILTFMFANGVPMDDILIMGPCNGDRSPKSKKVLNVEDCKKARDWLAAVRADYYDSENGAPKHPGAVGVVIVTWKDGFCYNRCKGNRSIDVKTMNVGAPKDMINGTDNTFPMAIGMKKAKGWDTVERLCAKDFQELETTSKPHLFFHGVTYKMIPVFVKRFAVLADRPERAVLSSTLSYSSNLHRRFSVSGKIQTPRCYVDAVESLFLRERSGASKASWGWSDALVDRSGDPNGAKLPSCRNCRKQRLESLGMIPLEGKAAALPCNKCTDWDMLGSNNKVSLDFPQHKDYPTFYTKGSPVPPPPGRDVFQPGGKIPFLKLTFKLMIQACKFAFFQASRKTNPWKKGVTNCYLRHCGVSPKMADLLHDLAVLARRGQPIGYDSPDGIESPVANESFSFPAGWSDILSLDDFIETVMHLLGLGVAPSNFDLITIYLKELPAGSGMSSTALRRAMQELLTDLKPLMLNWLNALPLNVSDKKGYTTGGWVGEQWVAFVRVSKPLFGWCIRNHALTSKFGVDDLSRVVISFHALMARCLTHSGIDEAFIEDVRLHLKEFLSCVRELDIRARYKQLNKPAKKASEAKKSEAFWLKANYLSLMNVLTMMLVLGPLILWWDGGGKGERYIQLVKPHIKRGVRGDILSYFTRLLEKLFKVMQMELLEKRYSGAKSEDQNSPLVDMVEEVEEVEEEVEEEELRMADVINELAGVFIGDDQHGDEDDEDGNDSEDGSTCEADDHHNVEHKKVQFSTLEELGMTKTRTIHVYRNKVSMNHAIYMRKPLAGIVQVTTSEETGETFFEFQIVYRKPVKQFARRKVTFDDANGISFFGMWCSEIQVDSKEESYQSTGNFQDIQSVAGHSAVAIPLGYCVGREHADANKYYVITNWWQERMSNGRYELPTLDSKLYNTEEDLEELLRQAATRGGGSAPGGAVAAVI